MRTSPEAFILGQVCIDPPSFEDRTNDIIKLVIIILVKYQEVMCFCKVEVELPQLVVQSDVH